MDLSEGGHFMSYLNDVFLGNQKPPFFFSTKLLKLQKEESWNIKRIKRCEFSGTLKP